VVTGAATIKVFVNGSAQPKAARVLGVSECSDLAVIDIEGDGYPFLKWFNGDIKPGIDVFAAGYPLDDPEFTLTKGIVSKAKAEDISPSSNIDHVIEQDANINPATRAGRSSQDAQVVGVNYAGFDAGKGTTVLRDRVRPRSRSAQLQQGENVDSLGINGTAVSDEESGTFGIWVNGVEWNHASHGQTGCMSQYNVVPTAGSSPLNIGTMAMDGWFPGPIGKVAIYDHLHSGADHRQSSCRRSPSRTARQWRHWGAPPMTASIVTDARTIRSRCRTSERRAGLQTIAGVDVRSGHS
jgi:hypothetical protein